MERFNAVLDASLSYNSTIARAFMFAFGTSEQETKKYAKIVRIKFYLYFYRDREGCPNDRQSIRFISAMQRYTYPSTM